MWRHCPHSFNSYSCLRIDHFSVCVDGRFPKEVEEKFAVDAVVVMVDALQKSVLPVTQKNKVSLCVMFFSFTERPY